MTLVVAAHLLNGLVLLTDSRATWVYPNGKIETRDLAQKVFDLTDHSAVAFCGDIMFAGIIIRDLLTAVNSNQRYKHIQYLNLHAKRIMEYSQRQAVDHIRRKIPKTEILLAGSTIEYTSDNEEREIEESKNLLAKYTFSFEPELKIKVQNINLNSICAIGSGAKIFPERTVEELIKNNPSHEDLLVLKDPELKGFMKIKGLPLSLIMKDRISFSKLIDVGGIIQRLTINHDGIKLSSLWKFHKEGKLEFEEGFYNDSWSKFDRTEKTLYKLLECLEIAEIPPYELPDV